MTLYCTTSMPSVVPMMPASPSAQALPGSLFAWTIGPGGKALLFMYQTVFKCVGVRLPFTPFERELITEINTAPAQLHPNS